MPLLFWEIKSKTESWLEKNSMQDNVLLVIDLREEIDSKFWIMGKYTSVIESYIFW